MYDNELINSLNNTFKTKNMKITNIYKIQDYLFIELSN